MVESYSKMGRQKLVRFCNLALSFDYTCPVCGSIKKIHAEYVGNKVEVMHICGSTIKNDDGSTSVCDNVIHYYFKIKSGQSVDEFFTKIEITHKPVSKIKRRRRRKNA
jgi:hypothetical protein